MEKWEALSPLSPWIQSSLILPLFCCVSFFSLLICNNFSFTQKVNVCIEEQTYVFVKQCLTSKYTENVRLSFHYPEKKPARSFKIHFLLKRLFHRNETKIPLEGNTLLDNAFYSKRNHLKIQIK